METHVPCALFSWIFLSRIHDWWNLLQWSTNSWQKVQSLGCDEVLAMQHMSPDTAFAWIGSLGCKSQELGSSNLSCPCLTRSGRRMKNPPIWYSGCRDANARWLSSKTWGRTKILSAPMSGWRILDSPVRLALFYRFVDMTKQNRLKSSETKGRCNSGGCHLGEVRPARMGPQHQRPPPWP